ncbi:MAG: 2-C-methyl-D-erythritol 4-phosphate cytidylyltransferase [Syntrophaceae bacterium]|nr:2-C-methyl-D-erythritol 4-phosphate cytidylyltransferase [Syntrophaceae bacterium]
MKIVAIIPAGGLGLRMGSNTPKPYLILQDRPVILHTLQLFQEAEIINDIYLVVHEPDIQYVEQQIVKKYALDKVKEIVAGGAERQDSVYQGIQKLRAEHEIIVVHDGVRPLLDVALLERTIATAKEEGAAITAVPVKDTIKSVDNRGMVEMTLDRSRLYHVQTPQAFKREIIMKAYDKAYQDDFYGTDDASLVERLGMPVKIVMGSYENIKLTTPEDLLYAEKILKLRE